MDEKELAELMDHELLDKAKKNKTTSVLSALTIGIMIGVVIWSIAKNTVGLFTLIPLYFAYRLLSSPKDNNALNEQLQERNLK